MFDGVTRNDNSADGAGDFGDEGVVDTVDGSQRLFDLAGVHGGAADLEHVIAAAVVEHEPVVVEMPEIAGGVVAVDREQFLAAAATDATHHVWPAQLDHADV